MVRLRQLAILGLAGVPGTLADAGPDDITCVDQASHQTSFTAATGAVFEIVCATDYAGGDMGATSTSTFAGCVEACAAAPGCKAVAYVGESCYLKNTVGEAAEREWVWGARLVQASSSEDDNKTPLSCVDNASDGVIYQASNDDFEITCGKDYAGGDLLGLGTASFEECIEACDSNDKCVNVAYVHGACYLKQEQKPAVDNAAVWGAVRKVTSTGTTAPSSPSAPTASPSAALSCENNASHLVKYTSGKNGLYQIICGVDFAGNDIDATTTDTFEECIAACDENTECVDVSYVAPWCYMKSVADESIELAHVWTAKQLKSPGSIFNFPTVTNSTPGPDDTEEFFEPIVLEPAPIATLGPVPPPGVNMAGTGVLTPDPVSELWYNGTQSEADGSDAVPVVVRLNITYSYPSIVLDHSIWIKDVACEAGVLHGRFNTSYPFYYAKDTWPSDEEVLLITTAPTCSDDETGQNAFFLATTISFDDASLSFEALGQTVELKDVFAELDIDFGDITVDTPAEEEEPVDACGSPESDTLLGLPAVPCGWNFDKTLDEKLGFYSDDHDAQAVLALAFDAPEEIPEDQTPALRPRWGWLSKAVSWVSNAVTTVVNVVVKAVETVAVAAYEVGKQLAVGVYNFVKDGVEFMLNVGGAIVDVAVAVAKNAVELAKFAVTGDYQNTLVLPVNLMAPDSVLVSSPWGRALRVYRYTMDEKHQQFDATKERLQNIAETLLGDIEPEPGVDVFCINCGARGRIEAVGKISATPLSGVKHASITIKGNLYVGMYVGVNGFAQWEKEFEKEIFERGLPGWSIPGIVTLGPTIKAGSKFVVSFEAEGQLMTGASLTWSGFEAVLDLKDSRNSRQSGWTPEVDYAFQVHGAATATAAVGVPVGVWFGIDILNGLFRQGAELVDTPGITATAASQISLGTEEISFGEDECPGIAWDIKLTNEVTLEIDHFHEWKLFEWASPALAEGCIPLIGGSSDDESTTPGNNGTIIGNPEIPSLPPPLPGDEDDGSVKCPDWDGQVISAIDGDQYRVYCSSVLSNSNPYPSTTTEGGLAGCLDWCKATRGQDCYAVTFRPNPSLPQGHGTCVAAPSTSYTTGSASDGHTLVQLNPFQIVSVVFGNIDITQWAASRWYVGNHLEINTDILLAGTNGQDPLPGIRKSVFMLYYYGAELRTWVGLESSGMVYIRPGPVSQAPSSTMLVPDWKASEIQVGLQLRPGSLPPQYNGGTADMIPVYMPNFIQIIDICYGTTQLRNRDIWNNVYLKAYRSEDMDFGNGMFGDTWVGIRKSGVIWYRDTRNGPDGPLRLVAAIEGDMFRLMNPHGSFKRRDLALPRQADDAPYGNSTLPSNGTVPTTTATAITSTGTATPQFSIEGLPPNGVATVRDLSGTTQLLPATNGNLFVASVNASSADIALLTNGTVLNAMVLPSDSPVPYLINSDSAERILHYFPDELAKVGASRLRLATWDRLPVGSRVISLAPIARDDGEPVLLGIAGDDHLFPVMCAIEGQLDKVFLVRDVSEASLRALETDEMRFVLTGGRASSCGPLAMTASVVPDSE